MMVRFLEHFNACNNNGVPFAHIGSSPMRKGYLLEARGEMGYETIAGFSFQRSLLGTCFVERVP